MNLFLKNIEIKDDRKTIPSKLKNHNLESIEICVEISDDKPIAINKKIIIPSLIPNPPGENKVTIPMTLAIGKIKEAERGIFVYVVDTIIR